MNPSQDTTPATDNAAANAPAQPATDQSKALALSITKRDQLMLRIGAGDKVEEIHVSGINATDALQVAQMCVNSGKTVPKSLAKACNKKALAGLRKQRKTFLMERTSTILGDLRDSDAHIDKMGEWKTQRSGDQVLSVQFRKPAVKTIVFKSPEEAQLAIKAGLRKAHFSDEARAELCKLLGGKFEGPIEQSNENATDVDASSNTDTPSGDTPAQLAPVTEM